MSGTEFTVGQFTYMAARLDAFTQLNIARKIAPIMAGIAAGSDSWKETLEPLAQAPAEDVDYIVRSSVAVVKRKTESGWVAIYNPGAKTFMFDDISAIDLLEISQIVTEEYVRPFLEGLAKKVFGTPTPTPE